MSRQGEFADLFLVFPAILETWQKVFHSYSFIIFPEMRPLGTFWSIVSNGYYGNNDRYKNFHFSLAMYLQVLQIYKISSPSSDRRKVINDQNFKFFVSGHLNPNWTGLF